MKISIKAFWLPALIFATLTSISAQDPNIFTSGDGGFAIDIPRSGVTVADISLRDPILKADGKTYTWEKQGEYYYEVGFYKMDRKLTAKEKTQFLDTYKGGFLGEVQKAGAPSSETPYSFQGNTGVEIKVNYPAAKMMARFFATDTRFYFLIITSGNKQPGSATLEILNSFRFLDAAALKAVKIEEAAPAPLPQEPPAKKLRSDLEDGNLKGRVKEILEDVVSLPGTLRERSGEKYYDTRGNLTRKIELEEGYPWSIEIWGSIDGSRVSAWRSIDFDDDQRPPPRRREIIQNLMESPKAPPGMPQKPVPVPDPRYTNRYAYKYDESGRLLEISKFDDSGESEGSTIYKYAPRRRDERETCCDGEEYDHKAYLLDAAGNIVEESAFNEKDVVEHRTVYKYEFDAAGNWIVRRAFEKKTVRGKTVLKPISITYRTIAYYQ